MNFAICRWNGAGKKQGSDAHVLNHHYLKNLSIEVALANAGYSGKAWHEYILSRTHGTSLDDANMRKLIEYFWPFLYNQCARSKAAYEGKPMFREDAISETNYRFLVNLREITFFWIQDAVILLDSMPELQQVEPWAALLKPELRPAFDAIGTAVLRGVDASALASHQELLTQQDLMRRVHQGALQSSHVVSDKLATVPGQVAAICTALWNDAYEKGKCDVRKMVHRSVARGVRRMLVAGAHDPGDPDERSLSLVASQSSLVAASQSSRVGSSSCPSEEGSAPPDQDLAGGAVDVEPEAHAEEAHAEEPREDPLQGDSLQENALPTTLPNALPTHYPHTTHTLPTHYPLQQTKVQLRFFLSLVCLKGLSGMCLVCPKQTNP